MTDTLTPTDLAVVGRRIEFAYYSNLQSDSDTLWHPGIITAIEPGYTTQLACIRLDGERRSGIRVPFDYEGLRYLDQVVGVPALPMGRFTPAAANLKAETYEGVPAVELEEGDLLILTDDQDRAGRILTAYAMANDWALDGLGADRLKKRWVAFEWAPEDAEYDWLVGDAAPGDEHAVHVHYLPA